MELGLHQAVITRNSIETIETKDGAKPAIVIGLSFPDFPSETGKLTLWTSDKALSLTYRDLRTCGFDVADEKLKLYLLIERPEYLKGNEIQVVAEKRGNYWNYSMPHGNATPPKAEVERIEKALKSIKNRDHNPNEPEVAPPPPDEVPPLSGDERPHNANDPHCLCKACIPF